MEINQCINNPIYEEFLENLFEASPKVVIRVNSKGQRVRKKTCGKGFKLVNGTRCVAQKSSEKAARRRGSRKAVRAKKRNSAGQRKANLKRKRALMKRKSMGLKKK